MFKRKLEILHIRNVIHKKKMKCILQFTHCRDVAGKKNFNFTTLSKGEPNLKGIKHIKCLTILPLVSKYRQELVMKRSHFLLSALRSCFESLLWWRPAHARARWTREGFRQWGYLSWSQTPGGRRSRPAGQERRRCDLTIRALGTSCKCRGYFRIKLKRTCHKQERRTLWWIKHHPCLHWRLDNNRAMRSC